MNPQSFATNICTSLSVTTPALSMYTDQLCCRQVGSFTRQSTCVYVQNMSRQLSSYPAWARHLLHPVRKPTSPSRMWEVGPMPTRLARSRKRKWTRLLVPVVVSTRTPKQNPNPAHFVRDGWTRGIG